MPSTKRKEVEKPSDEVLGANAQGALKSLVERLERLDEDKDAIVADMKEVFAQAKGEGFDTRTIRTILRLRKQDRAKRLEAQALLDLYAHALGWDLV